jgi:putative SOS response-associated peptidase YedK
VRRIPRGQRRCFELDLLRQCQGAQAIRDFTQAMRSDSAICHTRPGAFPDHFAPIVRNGAEGASCSWRAGAFAAVRPQREEPGPQRHEYPQCRVAAWRRWLELENRCVVPSSSFSDNEVLPDGMRSPVWLAFDESRPLAFFAGLWTCWSSVRKVKVRRDANDLFAFLTTEPNAEDKAIHRKAMPVILTTQAEINAWLTAKATQP